MFKSSQPIHQVGDVENPQAAKVRLVHLSDTHLRHDSLIPNIPEGDILIHSGDFARSNWKKFFWRPSVEPLLEEINSFFGKMNFKHKIFVAGNHEMVFEGLSAADIQQRLPHVIYLQDSTVELEGIKFYGSPWTDKKWSSLNRGFAKPMSSLGKYWDKIPSDTDVLVTHMPPQGVSDLGGAHLTFLKAFSLDVGCSVCGEEHPDNKHWGCPRLRRTVLKRVRPKIHMFGHVHECHGVQTVDEVLMSNGALAFFDRPNVFDYFITRP